MHYHQEVSTTTVNGLEPPDHTYGWVTLTCMVVGVKKYGTWSVRVVVLPAIVYLCNILVIHYSSSSPTVPAPLDQSHLSHYFQILQKAFPFVPVKLA